MDAADVLTISGNYEISQDPSVTIQDEHGNEDTFDKQNATIKENNGDLKITVGTGTTTELVATDDLTVVTSGNVKGGSKKGKKHHGHGRANKINCEQTLSQTQNQTVPDTDSDFLQYSNADQIQYCVINRAKRGGGGNNGGTSVTLEYNNDEEITTQTQPEGQVLNTSTVATLPFTGGFVPISVAASIAGIALFGAGVGVSLWQLRGGRGRSDD